MQEMQKGNRKLQESMTKKMIELDDKYRKLRAIYVVNRLKAQRSYEKCIAAFNEYEEYCKSLNKAKKKAKLRELWSSLP